jgi:hypothetical protein
MIKDRSFLSCFWERVCSEFFTSALLAETNENIVLVYPRVKGLQDIRGILSMFFFFSTSYTFSEFTSFLDVQGFYGHVMVRFLPEMKWGRIQQLEKWRNPVIRHTNGINMSFWTLFAFHPSSLRLVYVESLQTTRLYSDTFNDASVSFDEGDKNLFFRTKSLLSTKISSDSTSRFLQKWHMKSDYSFTASAWLTVCWKRSLCPNLCL